MQIPKTLRSLQVGAGCGWGWVVAVDEVGLLGAGAGEDEDDVDVDVPPPVAGWLLGADQDFVEWLLEAGASAVAGDAALPSVFGDPAVSFFVASSFSEDDSESLEVIGSIEEARRSDAG